MTLDNCIHIRNEIYSCPLIFLLFPHTSVCWLLLSLGGEVPVLPLVAELDLRLATDDRVCWGKGCYVTLESACSQVCAHCQLFSQDRAQSLCANLDQPAKEPETSLPDRALLGQTVLISHSIRAWGSLSEPPSFTTSRSNGLNTGPWFLRHSELVFCCCCLWCVCWLCIFIYMYTHVWAYMCMQVCTHTHEG